MDIPPIGFLGAGKMATALARGWISARLVKRDQIVAADPLPDARKEFARSVKTTVYEANKEVIENSTVVILAVKTAQVPAVLKEIGPLLVEEKHLLISIAAGVTLETIKELVGYDVRIVRVMPNTPAQVRASASAYSCSLTTHDEDKALVDRLLNAVGRAFEVPEKMLDAVTGLSGSGPAFIFMMIEALSDGGVRMGLPRNIASELAAQTVFGAAKMVIDTNSHPGELKDMVTSPGGTTIAGVHALEAAGIRVAFMNAVQAATERSRELADE